MNAVDVTEAARILDVSTDSVCRLARQGKIPAAKPGRSWRFLPSALHKYLRGEWSPTSTTRRDRAGQSAARQGADGQGRARRIEARLG